MSPAEKNDHLSTARDNGEAASVAADAGSPGGESDDTEAMSMGQRVRYARRSLALTKADLAHRSGVKVKTVRAWERDELEPRPNKLLGLAGLLNVSLKWLLTGEEADGQGPADHVVGPEAENIEVVLAELGAVRSEQVELANRISRLTSQLQQLSEASDSRLPPAGSEPGTTGSIPRGG